MTQAELKAVVQRRLGDEAGAIWDGESIDAYLQQGYDELAMNTGCLWETVCFPDYAYAFNYTQEWEREYFAGLIDE